MLGVAASSGNEPCGVGWRDRERMMLVRNGVWSSVLALLFAAVLGAQSDPGSQPQHQTKSPADTSAPSAAAKQSAAGKPSGRIELEPVRTSDAARLAARAISKRKDASPARSAEGKPTDNDSSLGTPDSSAVDEFKPGRRTDSTGDAVVVKESKKSAARNIHGTAYGGLDPAARGNHEAGGSVGTTSKSGKTSVYVETDSSRAASSSH